MMTVANNRFNLDIKHVANYAQQQGLIHISSTLDRNARLHCWSLLGFRCYMQARGMPGSMYPKQIRYGFTHTKLAIECGVCCRTLSRISVVAEPAPPSIRLCMSMIPVQPPDNNDRQSPTQPRAFSAILVRRRLISASRSMVVKGRNSTSAISPQVCLRKAF